MTRRERAAAACYLVPALTLLAFGLVYLTASEFMPYHETGMQRSWQELTPEEQGVMLAALRGGGASFLFPAVTILLLLAIPFRRGDRWAYKALPGLVLLSAALSLYTALTLTLLTPAAPPWPLVCVLAGLALAGYVLAPAPSRSHGA